MLKVQGHILLLIWMKQLQDDAPPRLALNQLAQIVLQQMYKSKRPPVIYTPHCCPVTSCPEDLDFMFDICA